MQPLGARVLIRPQPAETESAGGLTIVREFAEPDVLGTVVSLGSGVCGASVDAWRQAVALFERAKGWACYEKPGCDCPAHAWMAEADALIAANPVPAVDVAVGDRVLFPATSGQEIRLDDERYIILPLADVLAVVEEDAERYNLTLGRDEWGRDING